jgi:hypothetical protein
MDAELSLSMHAVPADQLVPTTLALQLVAGITAKLGRLSWVNEVIKQLLGHLLFQESTRQGSVNRSALALHHRGNP